MMLTRSLGTRSSSLGSLVLSFTITCCIFLARLAHSSSSSSTPSLPTIIVRGFLNYRTTVDGTVLLFTPDAGGGSATSVAPIIPTATLAETILATARATDSSPEPVPVEPTSVVSSINQDDTGPPAKPVVGDPDEWRPVATSGSTAPAPPTQQAPARAQPVPATTAASTAGRSEDRADTRADGLSPPDTPPARARRPSLRGEGARSAIGSRPDSINGIRRPGLGLTTAAGPTNSSPPTWSNSTIGSESRASSAFQSRLTNASAKLRNKFRKNSATTSASVSQTGSPPAPQSSIIQVNASSTVSSLVVEVPAVDTEQSAPSVSTSASGSTAPAVGSDEILAAEPSGTSSPTESASPTDLETSRQLVSRSGEQRPGSQLASGELLGGQLTNSPIGNLDNFFQGDQPNPDPAASEPKHTHSSPTGPKHAHQHHHHHHHHHSHATHKSANDRLHGWLDQHHNKYIPRPEANKDEPPSGHLSQKLAANLNGLSPSFVANLPTSVIGGSELHATPTLSVGSPESTSMPSLLGGEIQLESGSNSSNVLASNSSSSLPEIELAAADEPVQMTTITRTYSTIMSTSKTRMVPIQVKSSTAVHTVVENYVITKLLTVYQTLPVGGEFILGEPLATRAPYELFNEPEQPSTGSQKQSVPNDSQPAASVQAAAPAIPAPSEPTSGSLPEQPISQPEQKSPNDFLHDFSNLNNALGVAPEQSNSQLMDPTSLANLLASSGEPLDQLDSSVDPASLLAERAINLPDLNNPLVLAAAIQNPQLAAVILAAQQLKLKQRQLAASGHQAGQAVFANNLLANAAQQVPIFSTSLSTQIRPSTYTVKDTMYTTRLVSFKDGRTVRTRTVSEPGQVIEQVLTTLATEVTPVTITIRPTGALTAASGLLATLPPTSGSGQQPAQATINNAVIATQLAALLARRQQQQQQQPQPVPAGLAALQQLLAQQQRAQQSPQQARQFQPNLQQLLQSMQNPSTSSTANTNTGLNPLLSVATPNTKPESSDSSPSQTPTPPLPNPIAPLPTFPLVTTITNLQVRTYTVHNAFKTIYRTITNTQLITSTILPGAARSTQLATGAG